MIDLVLPAVHGPAGETVPPRTAPPSPPAPSKVPHGRILLVEDHQPTAAALTQLLVRRGYLIVSATCIAEARRILGREKFDILISDLGLPDGNGCEIMGGLDAADACVGIR